MTAVGEPPITSSRKSTSGRTLRVHPNDNVLVALTDLHQGEAVQAHGKTFTLSTNVPAKHKFVTENLRPGDAVTMYGIPSWVPMSCTARMLGWLSAATDRASRSKRCRRSASAANDAGRTLTATVRSSIPAAAGSSPECRGCCSRARARCLRCTSTLGRPCHPAGLAGLAGPVGRRGLAGSS